VAMSYSAEIVSRVQCLYYEQDLLKASPPSGVPAVHSEPVVVQRGTVSQWTGQCMTCIECSSRLTRALYSTLGFRSDRLYFYTTIIASTFYKCAMCNSAR